MTSPSSNIDYRALASEHTRVVTHFFEHHDQQMQVFVTHVAALFREGGCLFFCGNGGSACDAMHIAGEFVGRFKRERRGLPAMALSADSGVITAIANDYDFSRIFSRQLEALGQGGDILVALSTSGRSPNILAALQEARERGIATVLFTGRKGAEKAALVDRCFVIDSEDTARIQECYMVALHALAEGVEIGLTS
jgi:D-sedoheptulose 7-phosphate isomerase